MGYVNYVDSYYSQKQYQPTDKDPIKHTRIDFMKCKLRELADKYIKQEYVFPNHTCGECVGWLAYEANDITYPQLIQEKCKYCHLYIQFGENEDKQDE